MDINWAELTIGFMLGLLPVVVPAIVAARRARRSAVGAHFSGPWTMYYLSPGGHAKTPEAKLLVSYSFWRRSWKVIAHLQSSAKPTHTGSLAIARSLVVIDLKRSDASEPISLRLYDDARGAQAQLTGLIMGIDSTFAALAGPVVISRSALTEQSLDKLLVPKTYLRARRNLKI